MEHLAVHDELHDLFGGAERRDRIAAAQPLGDDGDVRLNVIELLRAAGSDPHAGDHFVEDQERLVVLRQRLRTLPGSRAAVGWFRRSPSPAP